MLHSRIFLESKSVSGMILRLRKRKRESVKDGQLSALITAEQGRGLREDRDAPSDFHYSATLLNIYSNVGHL